MAILTAIAAGVMIGWAVSQMRERLSAQTWDEVAEGSTVVLVLLLLLAVIFGRGFDVAIRVASITWVVLFITNVIANLLWEEFERHSAASRSSWWTGFCCFLPYFAPSARLGARPPALRPPAVVVDRAATEHFVVLRLVDVVDVGKRVGEADPVDVALRYSRDSV
jgi:hypothetical protein